MRLETNRLVLAIVLIVVGLATAAVNEINIGGKKVDVGLKDLKMLAVHPGCDYVGQEEILDQSVYTCPTDECDVVGVLYCDSQETTPRVVARCHGKPIAESYRDAWFAWDEDSDGDLEYFEAINQQVSGWSEPGLFTCPGGFSVKRRYDNKYWGSDDLLYQKVEQIPDMRRVDLEPNGVSGATELLKEGSGYECNWGLCVSSDPNYPYCNKVESYSDAWRKSSSEKTIYEGSQVTFIPRGAGGMMLPQDKYKIVVTKYDCTCKDECDENEKLCSPKEYEYTLNNKCYNVAYFDTYEFNKLRCEDGSVPMEKRGVDCPGTGYSKPWCRGIDYSNYKICDATDTNGCSIFSSDRSCGDGLVCRPYDGNVGDTGVGECVCRDDVCVYGERQCNGAEYRTCVRNSQGCSYWGAWLTCPKDQTQLICNPVQSQPSVCIPPLPICDDYESECVSSTTLRVCKRDSNNANYWDEKEVIDCCVENADCLVGQECVNNNCQDLPGWCVDDSDCDSPRVCDNRQCVCPSGGEWCDGNSLGYTRCAEDNVVEVCKQDPITGCFKWQFSSTCQYPTVCVEHSPARCEAPGEIYALNEETYAANKPISIPIVVSQSVGDIEGTQIRGTITSETGATVSSTSCILTKEFLSNDYKCSLEFSGLSSKGSYTLKVQTTLSGIDLEYSTDFLVFLGVGVNMEVQSILYTHEPVVVYLSVKDENGKPVPMCSQTTSAECFNRWIVDVEHNGEPVEKNIVNTGVAGKIKLTFNAPTVGTVKISARTDGGQIVPDPVSKEGIPVEAPTITIEENFPTEVDYGTNRFEFQTYGPSNDPDISKQLIDVPVDSLRVEVQPPNTASYVLTPKKQGTGRYYFTIDMPKSAGQSYFLTITANYLDWPTATTPDITVIARSGTVDPASGTDWQIIAIVALAAVTVITFLLTRVRRR